MARQAAEDLVRVGRVHGLGRLLRQPAGELRGRPGDLRLRLLRAFAQRTRAWGRSASGARVRRLGSPSRSFPGHRRFRRWTSARYISPRRRGKAFPPMPRLDKKPAGKDRERSPVLAVITPAPLPRASGRAARRRACAASRRGRSNNFPSFVLGAWPVAASSASTSSRFRDRLPGEFPFGERASRR